MSQKVVSDFVDFLGVDKQRIEEFFENYHDHGEISLTLNSTRRGGMEMRARWNSKRYEETGYTRTREFIARQLQVMLFLYRTKQAHLSQYFKLTL